MSVFRASCIVAAGVMATLCASCAPAQRLPLDPGTPTDADEASTVYFDASRAPCSLEPLTAEVSIRGTIAKRPINGRFLFAGATERVRLESVGRTSGEFVFTAEEATETFLYRGDARIAGNSADMIATILGLPLDADDLRRVLTGCPRISGSLEGFRFKGRSFRVRLDGDTGYDVYAHRESDRPGWTIRVIDGPIRGTTDRWHAEFERDAKGLPKSVRVVSTTWNGARGQRFDVRLSFRGVRTNLQLSPATFRIEPSLSVVTIDLEAFRRSRPEPARVLIDPR